MGNKKIYCNNVALFEHKNEWEEHEYMNYLQFSDEWWNGSSTRSRRKFNGKIVFRRKQKNSALKLIAF